MADTSRIALLVQNILNAPDVDLDQISVKVVREKLPQMDEDITEEWMDENAAEVKAIIKEEFAKFQADQEPEQEEQEEDAEGEDDDDKVEEGPSSPKRRKTSHSDEGKKATKDDGDAEIARQLSSELNARSRRSTAKPATKTRAKKSPTKRGKYKSADTIDSDMDSDVSSSEAPTKKRKRAEPAKKREGGGGGGFSKLMRLSAPLAEIIGCEKESRPQVVKKLWVYIKDKELQNPNNKREILADDKFRAVFSVDKIDMFQMNKKLGAHLYPDEDGS
ncbi:SWIB-domain-containing protein [Cylindrobasidium torrendii FP15055 ss-10]|uniref:SWIB-domain-containing protein n=1 Tax=Cylindrobasidium torrendii FP15055 ss-10 TaxID=1314674 RepID=A0A0D7BC26_9AGAR|nr:SWIB-domain-containing protein [Cylindrobasidium torrendii FP15055 ss-10]